MAGWQMTPESIIDACRVPETVPCCHRGIWEIRRQDVKYAYRKYLGQYPSMTVLLKTTMATLHLDHGDVVMEDSERELKRHLPILLAAKGRILVSGLGLGCVVRGLLANPHVQHIDVVEIDDTILDLVGPEFRDNGRVTLHHADALKIKWPRGKRWDFAWHDIHDDDGHLSLLHRYRHCCHRQGAWMLPRFVKKLWPRELIG